MRLFGRQALKFEIVLGLAWARFLISFVPFHWWRRCLGALGSCPVEGEMVPLNLEEQATATSVGRRIRRAASRLPFEATCLAQAMTARWTLERRGIPTRLLIGSRQDGQDSSLELHAWLLAGGSVITGGAGVSQFSVFRKVLERLD